MKIWIYAIAKDEAKHIARFMASTAGADGVSILDTGSTDDTAAQAAALGAQVAVQVITPWRFDAARNASLALLPDDVDICVSLDLDEILLPGWRDEIEKAWTQGTTALRHQFIATRTVSGEPNMVFWPTRVHARHGYRWVQPIHEVLACQGVEIKRECSLTMEHLPDNGKSRAQYLDMLRVATEDDPTDDRNAHYYGRELFYYRKYPEAIRELQRHLALPRAVWKPERAASMRILATIAQDTDDHPARISWLLRACAESNERESWVELAQAYYDARNYPGTLFAAKQALAITERSSSYFAMSYAWGSRPWDLASIGSWYCGAKDESLRLAVEAARLEPDNQRIQGNVATIRSLLGSDEYTTDTRAENLIRRHRDLSRDLRAVTERLRDLGRESEFQFSPTTMERVD